MKIKRKSPRTGQWHEADLPITDDQISKYLDGEFIQTAFPSLNADQREFLLSGV